MEPAGFFAYSFYCFDYSLIGITSATMTMFFVIDTSLVLIPTTTVAAAADGPTTTPIATVATGPTVYVYLPSSHRYKY